MESQTIYVVTTEGDVEGRSISTLGYATGKPEDIKNYFADKKTYSIDLQERKLIHIDAQSVKDRKVLIEEKKRLEQRLAHINELL